MRSKTATLYRCRKCGKEWRGRNPRQSDALAFVYLKHVRKCKGNPVPSFKRPSTPSVSRLLKVRERQFMEALSAHLETTKVLSSDFSPEQLKVARGLKKDGYMARGRHGWSITGKGRVALNTWETQ